MRSFLLTNYDTPVSEFFEKWGVRVRIRVENCHETVYITLPTDTLHVTYGKRCVMYGSGPGGCPERFGIMDTDP